MANGFLVPQFQYLSTKITSQEQSLQRTAAILLHGKLVLGQEANRKSFQERQGCWGRKSTHKTNYLVKPVYVNCLRSRDHVIILKTCHDFEQRQELLLSFMNNILW